jgi:hypothetical protein
MLTAHSIGDLHHFYGVGKTSLPDKFHLAEICLNAPLHGVLLRGSSLLIEFECSVLDTWVTNCTGSYRKPSTNNNQYSRFNAHLARLPFKVESP